LEWQYITEGIKPSITRLQFYLLVIREQSRGTVAFVAAKNMKQFPFIPASKVKELLDPKELIDLIEDALVQFSRREGVQQPVRTVVSVPKHNGYMKCM